MPSRPRRSAAPDSKEAATPPSTATSMLFALQPWPVTITVSGVDLRFAALPASAWLGALLSDDFLGDFLALAHEGDAQQVIEGLAAGTVDFDALSEAIMELVTMLSGRPWWFTIGLVATVNGAWDTIGGYLAIRGTNAAALSLQAWIDALLAVVMLHMKPEDRNGFLVRLNKPPAGIDTPVDVAINAKREEDVFLAQMRGGVG